MNITTRKQEMRTSRTLAPLGVAVVLALAGCGGGTDAPDQGTDESATAAEDSLSGQDTGAGHGYIEGAEEVTEPQLHLVSIDSDGAIGMVNLLDGTVSEPGIVGPPSAVTSDGRYLFADTSGGVEIVDSGVWTWDHADHFHYYRTSPIVLGAVEGEGPAVVATSGNATSGGTALFFPVSGEVVLLSNDALSRGRIEEVFRVETDPHDGLAAPLGRGAVITSADESGIAAQVRFHGADGAAVEAAGADCPEARGAITSRIGLVVGCADGAILATWEADEPRFEHIPYPEGADQPRATDFRGRKGRPVVAALAGDAGFWLLDTRSREWNFVPTETPLVQVSAASDNDAHVVALDRQGRVHVYDGETGTQIASTEEVLAEAVSSPELLSGVDLIVDRERAYLNDPVKGVVHEIDYRGDARIARSLKTPTTPDFYAETGR